MKKRTKTTISAVLCLSLLVCSAFLFCGDAFSATWNTDFTKTAGASGIEENGYPGLQGLAYDTYTGKDGYCFATNKNETKVAIVHFSMGSDGWCYHEKTVSYKVNNLGHANDGTVFKDDSGNKWLIVSVYGTVSDTNKAVGTDGKTIKLASIKLSEYSKGKAKVYGVTLSGIPSDFKITGVTFAGHKMVSGKKKAVVIIFGGNKFYQTYAENSNGKLKLTKFGDRARITKPTFSDGKEPAYQGVAYHNKYLYISGEGKSAKPTTMMLARIRVEDLFAGGDSAEKKMETCQKTISKEGGTTLKKNAPEAVFFTKLNGKSNLYISLNRKTSGDDADAIIRSAKRY